MAKAELSPAAARCLERLGEGPARPDVIAAALGMQPSTVRNALTELRRRGFVEPPKVWRLTAVGLRILGDDPVSPERSAAEG